MHPIDRVTGEVDRARDELVQLTADLVRIPTVNPPGEQYDACAHFLGDDLQRRGFAIEYITADGLPDTRFGDNGVVRLSSPEGAYARVPFVTVDRDGSLFVAYEISASDVEEGLRVASAFVFALHILATW